MIFQMSSFPLAFQQTHCIHSTFSHAYYTPRPSTLFGLYHSYIIRKREQTLKLLQMKVFHLPDSGSPGNVLESFRPELCLMRETKFHNRTEWHGKRSGPNGSKQFNL